LSNGNAEYVCEYLAPNVRGRPSTNHGNLA
jgi:hypothetical protein